MNINENRHSNELKKNIIAIEKELSQAGVFDGNKSRTYEDLETERQLLLKFLHLQTQYIKVLYHKLKEE